MSKNYELNQQSAYACSNFKFQVQSMSKYIIQGLKKDAQFIVNMSVIILLSCPQMQRAIIQGSKLKGKPLVASQFCKSRPQSSRDDRCIGGISFCNKIANDKNNTHGQNIHMTKPSHRKNSACLSNWTKSSNNIKQDCLNSSQNIAHNESVSPHRNSRKQSNLLNKSAKLNLRSSKQKHPLVRSFIIKEHCPEDVVSRMAVYNCGQQHANFVNNLSQCINKRSIKAAEYKRSTGKNRNNEHNQLMSSFNNLKVKQGFQHSPLTKMRTVSPKAKQNLSGSSPDNKLAFTLLHPQLCISPFTTQIPSSCSQLQQYCYSEVTQYVGMKTDQQTINSNNNNTYNSKLKWTDYSAKIVANQYQNHQNNVIQSRNSKWNHRTKKRMNMANNICNNMKKQQNNEVLNDKIIKLQEKVQYDQKNNKMKCSVKQLTQKQIQQSPTTNNQQQESQWQLAVSMSELQMIKLRCQTPKKRKISIRTVSPDRSQNSPCLMQMSPELNRQDSFHFNADLEQQIQQQEGNSGYLRTINF